MNKTEIRFKEGDIDLRVYYADGELWGGRILLSCDIKKLTEDGINKFCDNLQDIVILLSNLKKENKR